MPAICQATSPSPSLKTPSKGVFIPTGQARIIAQSLAQFEQLKPAYAERGNTIAALRAGLQSRDTTIAVQQRLLANADVRYHLSDQLRQDAEVKLLIYKAKAKRRGIIIGVGVGLPAAYGVYRAGKALHIF